LSTAWFVIQTRAGQERAVSRAVEKFEIEVFLPTFKRSIAVGRRREDVIRPLFPLYLFAAFEIGEPAWRGIFRVDGVQTILPINGHASRAEKFPIPVPERVIVSLQAAAILGGGHIPIMEDERQSLPRLTPGQQVRVIEGPFDGFQGLVDRDHKERVRVLLDILGRETPTMLPREALSAA